MEQSPTSPLGPTLASPGIGPNQHRFCLSVIRSLKKNKDAIPFLRPVDPVALGIPLYFQVIKTPMDLSTVERKLSSSNAAKPDPNPDNPHYIHVDEFAKDVRVIFTNCYTFNGLEHAVSQMAKRLEETFDRQMKQLPPPDIPKPVIPKAPSVKKQISPPVPKKPQVRRPSTSMPTIRRNDDSRPKREIHPPPPKDLPYTEGPKKMVPRKPKRLASKDDGTLEQLRFCSKVLSDLHRKQVWQAASPFYDPVDPVKLNIPDYFKFVKKPMDLSTMRKKLDDHQYPNAKKFEDDFRLMIKNCFIFNPPGTPVNIAGHELERIFNEKWAGLPVLHDGMSEDYEDEDDFDDDDETTKQQRMFLLLLFFTAHSNSLLERELAKAKSSFMTTQMSSQPKPKKEKKKVPKPLQASSSKPSLPKTPKPAAPAPIIKKKKQKPTDEDVLSFEQKKDLSEAITNLNEDKLGRVIQIIHDGVPEIRDSTEEIELEIDHLPAAVLTKLYNFVVRPLRAPTQKRTRGGKGTGTGGLKRKSMDEDVEAEKIRQLEQRMALFEQGGNAGLAAALADAGVSDHSSDSSDDSDSSASDSE
ncbi:Bromodomain-containing protein [Flagelloscypha sp. PMI_526]|nr:Bromodomain-containing protein [Flagelloscypha sp. PMI_526]